MALNSKQLSDALERYFLRKDKPNTISSSIFVADGESVSIGTAGNPLTAVYATNIYGEAAEATSHEIDDTDWHGFASFETGYVLKGTGSGTVNVGQLSHANLSNITEDDHHSRSHTILGVNDHSFSGIAQYQVVGGSALDTGGFLDTVYDGDTNVNSILRSGPAGQLLIRKLADVDYQSPNPFTDGFQIAEMPDDADKYRLNIGRIEADELIVKVFTADETRVRRGSDWLTPTFAVVAEDPYTGTNSYTLPAENSTVDIWFEDSVHTTGALFTEDEWVMVQYVNRSTGLTVLNVWGQVSSYTTDATNRPDLQQWTFTNRTSGVSGLAIQAGSMLMGFGSSGEGWIYRTTLGGGPRAKYAVWTGSNPRDGTNTTKVQIGDLSDVAGSVYGDLSNQYGLWAGDAVYIEDGFLGAAGGDFYVNDDGVNIAIDNVENPSLASFSDKITFTDSPIDPSLGNIAGQIYATSYTAFAQDINKLVVRAYQDTGSGIEHTVLDLIAEGTSEDVRIQLSSIATGSLISFTADQLLLLAHAVLEDGDVGGSDETIFRPFTTETGTIGTATYEWKQAYIKTIYADTIIGADIESGGIIGGTTWQGPGSVDLTIDLNDASGRTLYILNDGGGSVGVDIDGNLNVQGNITLDGTVDAVNIASLESTVASHVAAIQNVHGVTGFVVGTSDEQTLTNKTIDGAILSDFATISANVPQLNFLDTGADPDDGYAFWVDSATLTLYTINDSLVPTATILSINASGITQTSGDYNINSGKLSVTSTDQHIHLTEGAKQWYMEVDAGDFRIDEESTLRFLILEDDGGIQMIGAYARVESDGNTTFYNRATATGNANIYQDSYGTSQSALFIFRNYYGSSYEDRWRLGKNNSTESTGNAGSNFIISRYDDGGSLLNTSVMINRATGLITFDEDVDITGDLDAQGDLFASSVVRINNTDAGSAGDIVIIQALDTGGTMSPLTITDHDSSDKYLFQITDGGDALFQLLDSGGSTDVQLRADGTSYFVDVLQARSTFEADVITDYSGNLQLTSDGQVQIYTDVLYLGAEDETQHWLMNSVGTIETTGANAFNDSISARAGIQLKPSEGKISARHFDARGGKFSTTIFEAQSTVLVGGSQLMTPGYPSELYQAITIPFGSRKVGNTPQAAPYVYYHPNDVVGWTSVEAVFYSLAYAEDTPPTVQWEVSDDEGETWSNVSGETTYQCSIAVTLADSGNWYRAKWTNAVGDRYSEKAILTVYENNWWNAENYLGTETYSDVEVLDYDEGIFTSIQTTTETAAGDWSVYVYVESGDLSGNANVIQVNNGDADEIDLQIQSDGDLRIVTGGSNETISSVISASENYVLGLHYDHSATSVYASINGEIVGSGVSSVPNGPITGTTVFLNPDNGTLYKWLVVEVDSHADDLALFSIWGWMEGWVSKEYEQSGIAGTYSPDKVETPYGEELTIRVKHPSLGSKYQVAYMNDILYINSLIDMSVTPESGVGNLYSQWSFGSIGSVSSTGVTKAQIWLKVKSFDGNYDDYQEYTCEFMAGDADVIVPADVPLANYGSGGGGLVEHQAYEGSGPYTQYAIVGSEPWQNTDSLTRTNPVVRVGNLSGIKNGSDGEYGIIMGTNLNSLYTPYIRASNFGLDLYNVKIEGVVDGTARFSLEQNARFRLGEDINDPLKTFLDFNPAAGLMTLRNVFITSYNEDNELIFQLTDRSFRFYSNANESDYSGDTLRWYSRDVHTGTKQAAYLNFKRTGDPYEGYWSNFEQILFMRDPEYNRRYTMSYGIYDSGSNTQINGMHLEVYPTEEYGGLLRLHMRGDIYAHARGGDLTLVSTGGNILILGLPSSDPGVNNAIWDDSGTIKISSG